VQPLADGVEEPLVRVVLAVVIALDDWRDVEVDQVFLLVAREVRRRGLEAGDGRVGVVPARMSERMPELRD